VTEEQGAVRSFRVFSHCVDRDHGDWHV